MRCYEIRYFSMSRRKLAPVDAGFIMMSCVIAVVEEHKVGEPAGKIAGMVVYGFFICVYVLNIIEQHDYEKGYLLGDDDEQE